ncbi:MAG: chromate transporter [Treponema sp.]|nr:chromate transporter [Treponema sp.]
MNLFLLFFEFSKIGLFAVGGGLATLPFLFHLAENYTWLTAEIIGNGQALAQSAPGAIGVNMAANAGFYAASVPGAFVAAAGLVFPSIIIITIIAHMLAFNENRLARAVFMGLKPCATGLLAAAGFGVIRLSLFNNAASIWYEMFRLRECILFSVLFVLILKLKFHPAVYIGLAGAAGVILKL